MEIKIYPGNRRVLLEELPEDLGFKCGDCGEPATHVLIELDMPLKEKVSEQAGISITDDDRLWWFEGYFVAWFTCMRCNLGG